MRYAFWVLFCAFVCFLFAQKSGSVIGFAGAAQVISYGGIVGLGLAVATRKSLMWGLGRQLLFGVLWFVILTAFYFWVFRPVSYGSNQGVLFWGGVFAFLAPAICVLRGIASWWKASRMPGTRADGGD